MNDNYNATRGPLFFYSKLLLLYPKRYREEYAQQLLLTAHDMLADAKSPSSRRMLFARLYLDVFISAGKEHYRELGKTSSTQGDPSEEQVAKDKMRKIRVISVLGSMVFIAGILVAVLLLSERPAAIIPPMSSFTEAQALSQGKRESCAPHNAEAADRVGADDIVLEYGDIKSSRFELTASEGIKDVPAGTSYSVRIATYENGRAKGVVAYEKDYGAYNYTIQKLHDKGQWRFVSMTACNEE